MARAFLIGTSGWHYASWRGPFFPKRPADKEPASILRQSVSDGRTQRRILSDADAGSGQKLAGADRE